MISGTLVAADDSISALVQGDPGFDVGVAGTFVGTVTVQASPDQGTTWFDLETFTAPGIKTGKFAAAWTVRAIFKTGDYTSGSATVFIG